MTDWDGMSEDEIQAHLARVRARLEAQHVAELELSLAAVTEDFVWPPAPNTEHPWMAPHARFVVAGVHAVGHTDREGVRMTDPWAKDPELKAAMEAMYGPLPINDGEGFLHHLKANPTLLDPVDEVVAGDKDQWGAAINRRGQDEVHACLRCGERAHMAIIAEPPDKPRWLDLCFDCVRWLREHMDDAEMRPW